MFDSFEHSSAMFLELLTPAAVEDFCDAAPMIEPGSIHVIDGQEFIVLESFSNGTTAVIRKDMLNDRKRFGTSSDWKASPIRSFLNEDYYRGIAAAVGEDNIIPIARNLITMDGLEDYGVCEDKISLLSMDEYRKYHSLLGESPDYPDWWWLCTSFSTPEVGYSRIVCCVSSDGCVGYVGCDGSCGVRPFFLLNSSVLTS